jgi:hypothetical protein
LSTLRCYQGRLFTQVGLSVIVWLTMEHGEFGFKNMLSPEQVERKFK